jgi:hypothetical protein
MHQVISHGQGRSYDVVRSEEQPEIRLRGLIYGGLIMTKPPAAANQMVHNKLVNRKPMICAVCDRYISPFTGLPVILEAKDQIIEFAHPACCAHED